jgi:hypothetical protein
MPIKMTRKIDCRFRYLSPISEGGGMRRDPFDQGSESATKITKGDKTRKETKGEKDGSIGGWGSEAGGQGIDQKRAAFSDKEIHHGYSGMQRITTDLSAFIRPDPCRPVASM